MRRLLSILCLLTCFLVLYASPVESRDAVETDLQKIDALISHEQQTGDAGKEGEARWQRIVVLKNYTLTKELSEECMVQMKWFHEHRQWDHYYRAWQLRTNALCSLGELQQSLQETQRMLNDANKRDSKLGRAMAYKQIGIIYLNMKQTEPAIEALRHYAELMKDEEDDFSSLSNIYYRMAKAYDYDKDYQKELQVTNDWVQYLHNKVGKLDRPDVRECYNSCYLARAAAFLGLNKIDEAGMALDTAAHHVQLINTVLSLHHYYKMRARYYLTKGDAANTLLYTDSVYFVTDEKDDHTDELRGQALLMLGRGDEAARIFQRLYHEKDSVFGRDTRRHLDELNTLFQVDELKTEQQRTKLRYMLLTASSIVLALLLLLFFGWRSAIRQKKINEQLRIANEQAKASSKMKSEFIRNISHEIRTPLNVISGFTQILTAPDMNLPEDEKRSIQKRVAENSDRMIHLVDRMLELSDVSSETLIERVDHTYVQELVAQAIEQSGISLHTRPGLSSSSAGSLPQGHESAALAVTFNIQTPMPNVPLLTNRLYAVRALTQLLENAVKFTTEGSITLRMECTDSRVRFIVEDTGVGIPADQADHIFEEFVQLDDFTDGTGIGLTVAHSIAQRMGGELWLDTGYVPPKSPSDGKSHGARFVLELLSC